MLAQRIPRALTLCSKLPGRAAAGRVSAVAGAAIWLICRRRFRGRQEQGAPQQVVWRCWRSWASASTLWR